MNLDLDTSLAYKGMFTVTVGGFTFTLTHNDLDMPDGIHFDVRAADMNNPLFIETLNYLISGFREFQCFAELVYLKTNWRKEIKHYKEKDFKRIWRLCNRVEGQKQWRMNPDYLNDLREKVNKAIVQKFGTKARLIKPSWEVGGKSYRRVKEGKERREWNNHYGQHQPGFVYIMRFITEPVYYKIGCSTNPRNRHTYFELNFPFDIHIEHLIQTDDMRELETDLHRKFKDKKRGKSEFYDLTDDDLAWIKTTYPGTGTDPE